MGFSTAAAERARALHGKVDVAAVLSLAQSHSLGPLVAHNLQQHFALDPDLEKSYAYKVVYGDSMYH